MDLSIIIVNYQTSAFLETALTSIYTHTKNITFEIILIDNASTDFQHEQFKEKFPTIEIITNKTNLGFAAAVNIGIAKASGAYLALLNPDTQLLENSFPKMISVMKTNPNIGIIGPKTINSQNELQLSCRYLPTLFKVSISELFPANFIVYLPKMFRWKMNAAEHQKSKVVEQIIGACFLIKKEVIAQIGLFDESFFVYFEEIDFCRRALLHKWKTYFYAETTLHHFGNASALTNPAFNLALRYKSLYTFFRKYYPNYQLYLLKAFVSAGLIFKTTTCFLTGLIKTNSKPKASLYLKLLINHFSF